MIFLLQHNHQKVTNVSQWQPDGTFQDIAILETTIVAALQNIAKENSTSHICWCHESLFQSLDIEHIQKLAQKKYYCHSFHPYDTPVVDPIIGYVEESLFINVDKSVCFPTWQMSTAVGMVDAATVNACITTTKYGFEYFLSSLAKTVMPKGVFCYSDPQMLQETTELDDINAKTLKNIYPFVKQHYKTQWIFLLFIQRLLFDKRGDIFSLLKTLFSSLKKTSFQAAIKRKKGTSQTATIDVIIPTMGRAKYLLDVLQDLKKQELLPTRVIIVEQNADTNADSELPYLTTEDWPFIIEHRFIHQTGACNARNIALQLVESEFVFFADDDIRFDKGLLETAVSEMEFYNYGAVNFSCLQKGQKENTQQSIQWLVFGSGTTMVRSMHLKDITFNMAYEHGHGEDADFGLQLRRKGCDVIYLPHLQLLHLKAPVGGFRTKKVFPWEEHNIVPKPSPTVMYFKRKYATTIQFKAYKFMLFVKYYKNQSIKNPITYLRSMQKAWHASIKWSKKLPL